jgi:arylsulfatase A-like enzyme
MVRQEGLILSKAVVFNLPLMNNVKKFSFALMVVAIVFGASRPAIAENILLVIADDFGVDAAGVYSRDDLYGHNGEGATPAHTPTIDSLAASGVLFRNAYTNPICSPTRATILTGKYPHQVGVGFPVEAQLDVSETIIPEILPNAYQTAAIGKWHLTHPSRGPSADRNHPIDSGFDYFSGSLGGAVRDYNSWPKVTNSANSSPQVQNNYSIYATTDAANETIAKIADYADQPWFIWLAFHAPHTPFHAPDPALTTNDVTASSSNTDKYKAMVEAMDTELGRIIASMPAAVLADTTIIFIGDNGTPSGVTEAPFMTNHAKGTQYDGGINVPFIVSSSNFISASSQGSESLAYISTIDIFNTIAEIVGVSNLETAASSESVSIVPYLQQPSLPTLPQRPYVFTEHFEPNGFGPYTNHQRSMHLEDWKLIWRDDVFEEFYDLSNDPYETTNLLPVVNLTVQQLAIYDQLVCAFEAIDTLESINSSNLVDPSSCMLIINENIPIDSYLWLCLLGGLLITIVVQHRYS